MVARKEERTFQPNWPFVSLPKDAPYLPDLPPNLEHLTSFLDCFAIRGQIPDDIAKQLHSMSIPEASPTASFTPFKVVLPPGLKSMAVTFEESEGPIENEIVVPALIHAIASHPHRIDLSVEIEELKTVKSWEHPLFFNSSNYIVGEGKESDRKISTASSSSSAIANPISTTRNANLEKLEVYSTIKATKSWVQTLPDQIKVLRLDAAYQSQQLSSGAILRYLPSSLTDLTVSLRKVSEGDLCELPRGLVHLTVACKVEVATYPWPDILHLPRYLLRLRLPKFPSSAENKDLLHQFYMDRPYLQKHAQAPKI